jgi:hypothetical protein
MAVIKSFIPNDDPLDMRGTAAFYESRETALRKLYETEEAEKAASSAQEIKLDDSNLVSFPGFPYKFEALHEKILVSIDIFKSGYECKVCLGKKKLVHVCICSGSDRPGKRYSEAELLEIRNSIGAQVAVVRAEMLCQECSGDPESVRKDVKCAACKGVGATLVLPDASKNLPSTGIVVSMGKKARELASFSVGDRILFSPHAGQMIPTKAGLMFKWMDWYNGGVRITGADDLSAFDFIIQDE